MPTLTSYFNDMDDPRGGNAPRHKFCDHTAFCRCAAVRPVDMELFGQMKENFLRDFSNCLTAFPAMTHIRGSSAL